MSTHKLIQQVYSAHTPSLRSLSIPLSRLPLRGQRALRQAVAKQLKTPSSLSVQAETAKPAICAPVSNAAAVSHAGAMDPDRLRRRHSHPARPREARRNCTASREISATRRSFTPLAASCCTEVRKEQVRFDSFRFRIFSKHRCFGSVRFGNCFFYDSMRFGRRFLNASWFGPVRFCVRFRPVPRFLPVRSGFLFLPVRLSVEVVLSLNCSSF